MYLFLKYVNYLEAEVPNNSHLLTFVESVRVCFLFTKEAGNAKTSL